MEKHGRGAAVERLGALVGEWTMEARPPDGPPWPGEGRVSFDWLEGRTFLIQRWMVDLPEAPDGIAIIGLKDAPADAEADSYEPGDAGEAYRQHYFDSRGVHRIYEMTLSDEVWTLWRDSPDPFPQRFTGTFSDDGMTIAGRWEKADDGKTWVTDFDLTYTKVTSGD
jgi:hypothetical protein